jgi:hypothetical protein
VPPPHGGGHRESWQEGVIVICSSPRLVLASAELEAAEIFSWVNEPVDTTPVLPAVLHTHDLTLDPQGFISEPLF